MSHYVFKLPDIGEGVVEAELVAWHVQVGDVVVEDQPLAEVMTDKATVEMTSPVAGTIVSLHGETGDLAPVGAPLAVIETLAEMQVPDGADAPDPTGAVSSSAAAVDEAPDQPPLSVEDRTGTAALASPAVRARALALNIDLAQVRGRGPGGRIEHADLDALLLAGRSAAVPPASDAVQEIKVVGLRRRIAERMQEAKRRIPHFTYVEEIDVTALEDLRQQLNAVAASRPRLTPLPFLIRALVRVLPDFPQLNAHYDDEAGVVRRFAALHVGVATQTPDGLMVPVLRHAEAKGLWALADEITRLADAARSGHAPREALSGSTLTLTSLGALGGVVATPVINLPEVAILCPNRIVERPVIRHGQVVARKMMNLSGSFDHRVVDGYDAAAFIRALKGVLETPAILVADQPSERA